MTSTGEHRMAYDLTHRDSDPRPSRFIDPVVYAEWAARADRWIDGL